MYISHYDFMLGVISKMKLAASVWYANRSDAF